ncbi:MAG TPA: hypothetical protein VD997_17450 [Phycisphaerales bacterium]|nr:hypothetical protein [Phycisphaerales bacterium]
MLPSLSERTTRFVADFNEFVQARKSYHDTGQSHFAEQADRLAPTITVEAESLFRDLLPPLGFLGLQRAKLADVQHRANESVQALHTLSENWNGILETQVRALDTMRNETRALTQSLQEAAAEHGVARFAARFHHIANDHDQGAAKWLWTAVLCGSGAIVAAFCFYAVSEVKGPLANIENAYLFTTRIVIIGLLVLAATYCAGMFRVRAHLSEINRHRAAALDTFKEFVLSTHSTSERDAVLKATVRTIFSPVVTGLVNSRDEKANNEFNGLVQALLNRKD